LQWVAAYFLEFYSSILPNALTVKRIDAHQPFWKFYPSTGSRIDEGIKYLRWDYFPKDSLRLPGNSFEGCVAVQTDQSEKETDFLIALAKHHHFIKGIVGWVDLQAEDILERLEWYKSFSILKGFRHLLQDESMRDLMIQAPFKRGIAALGRYGFTYDLLVFPDQLTYSAQLSASFPDQKFVLDLMGWPQPDGGKIAAWRRDMRSLASNKNVYCKISGMITGMTGIAPIWKGLRVYIDEIVNAFGMDRLMYGSDWPICQVASSYEAVTQTVQEYFSTFSKEEQELFFIWNAVNFYNL
jgi:L-fuconolactonase